MARRYLVGFAKHDTLEAVDGKYLKSRFNWRTKRNNGNESKRFKALLDGFLERLVEHLKAGDKVQLTGFGSFELRERSARTGVNPATKEQLEIPASKYPAFKPGKSLKDEVN